MVQGINVNNYTAEQLKELKNAGVTGITDKDIESASQKEAKAAANATSDDEKEVSYKIEDDASKSNEAETYVEGMTAGGANLKGVIEELMNKCSGLESDMANVSKGLEQYQLQMSDVMGQVELLTDLTTEELEAITAETKEVMGQVEEKQTEIEEQQQVVTEVSNNENATEADTEKAEKAQETIQTLTGEVSTLSSKVDTKSKAEEMVKTAADVKLQLLGKTMEDVQSTATSALNDATNANEYADVTINKGMEAAEISSNKDARKAGFKGGFFGWFGSQDRANKTGDMAIATGEHLGNTTVGVGNSVKQIASQYDMTFSKSSNIEDLTSKEYVDTSKMDEMENVDNVSGFFNKMKVAKANGEVMSEVAQAAKDKKAEEEEAAKKKATTTTTEQA